MYEYTIRTYSEQLKDNYTSHTKAEYIGYRRSGGSDPLPGTVAPFLSGFAHNAPRTIPTHKQVYSETSDRNTTEYSTRYSKQPFRDEGTHTCTLM